MNSRNHRTDKAFRESLKTYQASPPEGLWNGISRVLDLDRRRTRIAWAGRIAAAAAVILAAGSIWLLSDREPRREMGRSELPEIPADHPETRSEQPEIRSEQPETRMDRTERRTDHPEAQAEQPLIRADMRERQMERPGAEPRAVLGRRESYRTERPDEADLKAGAPRQIAGKSITGLRTESAGPDPVLAERSQPEIPNRTGREGIDVFEKFGEKDHEAYDRWAVGGQVSPVYSYRNLDAGTRSAYSTGFYNEKENGIVSYAGGVNLNYFPAKRLSLQSGLYYSRMGMKVGNSYLASAEDQYRQPEISGTPTALANSSGRVELGPDQSDAVITSSPPSENFSAWDNAPTDGEGNKKQEVRDGEVLQHFEYLEVPLVLRYRVVDRRVGLNLLGGLSTNFLVGSNVYFQEGSNREFIGTTGDLKPVNYSSVLGLGLQYSIGGSLHLTMEPTFRYYLNSINTAAGIGSHPYSLGFFTGISYSF